MIGTLKPTQCHWLNVFILALQRVLLTAALVSFSLRLWRWPFPLIECVASLLLFNLKVTFYAVSSAHSFGKFVKLFVVMMR